MLKMTFKFFFSPECSFNILTGTNQKLSMPLVTLGSRYLEANGHDLNIFRYQISRL